MFTGTESAKPSHYKSVEISDIVNRIAPKVNSLESPLLEWILGGSIPCTPEVWPPRVKRISTRQSNVEDLVKLAKQFDYNMIQQEKERDIVTSDQCPGTSLHCPPSPNDCLNGGIPKNQVEPKGPSSAVQDIDEELNALFDGPTQHLNRRLSQISANSSQESKNNPECLREDCASLDAIKGTSAPSTDPNFDDDWENDDLLNDSFVLEMTQNPDILSVPPQATAGPVSQNSKASELVIKTSPPVSVQIPACAQRGQNNSRHTSLHTKETSTNRSTFMLDSKTQFQSKNTRSREPPKLNQKADGAKLHEQRHILPPHRPQATSANRSKQSTGGVAKSVKSIPDGEEKSLFGSDPLWGDEDDDLLYQVCDDMERISGRQNHSFKTGSWPPAKTSCQRPAACVLTRSHSMPEGKAVLSNENDYSNMPVDTVQKKSLHYDPGVECQYKFTKLSNSQRPGMRTCGTLHAFPQTGARASVAGNPTNLHPSTFKRHLSDPTALGNKVKCSAAEIEKKKQDAIARRRLRMQASQKPGAPS
uniref:Ewing's tumor-associated antigen 1 n=1 Tax=Denticeps clupeoides TaxID=299321 RepID=A0AAY4DGH8_9TELE